MPSTPGTCHLLLCLVISSTVHLAAPLTTPPMSSSSTPPTHSNFLSAALQGGRQRYLSCSYNPSVCLDREKNPWGGSTCCFQRFCKDTMNDPNHCGFCGRKCPFGLACCGGQCIDTHNDPHHCGSCFKACPGQLKCGFGMCDYGGGDL